MDGEHPRDPLDEIRSIEDNEAFIGMLVGQLQKPLGVTPFVGAGLSQAFGFPSWDSFLLDDAKKVHIEERIQQRLDAKEYEEAAEELLNERGSHRFHVAIRIAFGEENIEVERLDDGAVSVLPKFPDGPVITTNFDRVLEKAFERAGERFEDVIWGARAEPALRGFQQSRTILLKIHGDVEDSTDRIFTRQDYENYYGSVDGSRIDFSKPLPELLRDIFGVRPVLFLGCSLQQDRMMTILAKLASRGWSSEHYAIVARPESQEQIRTRSTFLDRHHILPIWLDKKYVGKRILG